MTSKNVVESLLGTRQVGGRLSVLRFLLSLGKVYKLSQRDPNQKIVLL